MDTIALSNAVQVALDITNSKNTLIVVTADHSHTLTISGYPARGNPILGYVADAEGVRQVDEEGRPYTTLSYANGPGSGCRKTHQRTLIIRTTLKLLRGL